MLPFCYCDAQLWTSLMSSVEWNKKPEIVIEQALRHVKANLALIGRFTKSDKAQVVLMVTMQEHAYQNQTFLKIFPRLCLVLYKGEYMPLPVNTWVVDSVFDFAMLDAMRSQFYRFSPCD